MIEQTMQALLVACAVLMLWALGKKYRWGWLVGVASEIPWAVLAVIWKSWGVIFLCVLYGGLYAKNYVQWGREG